MSDFFTYKRINYDSEFCFHFAEMIKIHFSHNFPEDNILQEKQK